MQSQWLLWWRRRPLLWRKQTSEITIEFHFCGNDASHDIHSQWAFNWYWLHFFRPVIPPSQWLQLARVMNKLGNHHNEFLINLCVKVMWNIKIFIEKKTFEFSSQIKFGMNEFIKFGMSDISIQPNRIGSPARYKIIKLYFYQHKLCNLFRARR